MMPTYWKQIQTVCPRSSVCACRKYLVLNSYASLKEAFVTQANFFSDRPTNWPCLYINDNREQIGKRRK